MSWKRPVIIWTSKNPQTKQTEQDQAQHIEEQAAAEELIFDSALASESRHPVIFKKKSKLQVLLITTLSAVVLGVIIGAVMLKLLTSFDAEETEVNATGQTSAALAEKSVLLTAYVLQGGVFSEKKNAEKWVKKYNKQGVPAVLWEREGNFYLFAGAAPAENQAREQAKKINSKKLDIYVKEWTAPIAKGTLLTAEKEWLKEFQAVWSNALQKTDRSGGRSDDEWQKLIRKAPPESNACQQLTRTITSNLDKLTHENPGQVQQALLNIWKSASAS